VTSSRCRFCTVNRFEVRYAKPIGATLSLKHYALPESGVISAVAVETTDGDLSLWPRGASHDMKQLKCMVVWTPVSVEHSATRGEVAIVPWPDRLGERRPYSYSAGACDSELHTMSESDRIAMLFITFNTLVVRDGIDPQAAHHAFLEVDEYRERIAPNAPDGTP
jgi:hypothetical protein